MHANGDVAFVICARTLSRLSHPREVVTVSAAGSRLLGRIDTRHLRFAHPHLPKETASWLGCAPLLETVEEVLDESKPLQLVDSLGLLRLETVKQLLGRMAFIQTTWSCVQSHVQTVSGLSPLTQRQVAAALRSLASHLSFVQSLSTRVVLRTSRQDITQQGDNATSRVYEFKKTSPPTQYIAEPPPGLSIDFLLASVISRELGSPVTLALQPLFTCPPDLVNTLRPTLFPGGWDKQLETAGQAGEPGAHLQSSDTSLLQLRPLRRYPAGELVAVQRSAAIAAAADAGLASALMRGVAAQPAAAAAEAAARREEAAAARASGVEAAVDDDDSASQEWCYARVLTDAAAVAGAPLYRIPLEVEPGVVVPMLSSQIYSFATTRSEAPDEPQDAVTAGQSSSGQTQTSGTSSATTSAYISATTSTTHVADAHGVGSPGSETTMSHMQGAAGRATTAGPVGSAQLVGAVRDLLGAAGLPLSLEQSELLSLAADAQAQTAKTQGELQELREHLKHQQCELEERKVLWQCRICYVRDVDASFTACGHMICQQCARALDRCPVCRKRSPLLQLYK